MPWLSIIVWLVSYFLSSKNGASSGKAALIATAAGLGTYYLADPANTENILGFSYGNTKATPGDVSGSTGAATTRAPSLGSTAVSQVGETLRSWGPLGTAGVVGVTAGALSGDNKWLWIGGAVLAALVVLK